MGIKNILLVGLSLMAVSAFGANTGVGYEVERCDKNMSAIKFAECVKASKEARKMKQDVITINTDTVKGLKKSDEKPAEIAAPAAAPPAAPAPAVPAAADPLPAPAP